MIILGKISYLSWNVRCVYSLGSPHRGDSNEYTHTIIVKKIENTFLNSWSPFASWPGTMIDPQ